MNGARSPGWQLAPTWERAIADGHPEPALLKQIAAVISDGADAAALDAFEAWRNA